MSYHKAEIKKGQVGWLSKVQEELDEAQDAEDQGCKILLLVELSDIMGAIEQYLVKNFPDMSMDDLQQMSKLTQASFQEGARS